MTAGSTSATPRRPLALAVSAAVAVIALWSSAAPTPIYALYASDWGLEPTVTTTVFAVYPIVLVVTLLIFGNVSDHIGRRSAMQLGVLANLIGAVLFAVAPDVGWLLVGRAFMGIGVGLSLSPASASIVESVAPSRRGSASSITTASTALGLVLAILIGGILIEYAPDPLHLSYWVLALVCVLVLVGSLALPAHTRAESAGRWRPRPVVVPRGHRRSFVLAALGVTSAYILGGVNLSLGGQIARELVGSTDYLVTSLLMAVFGVVVGVVSILFSRASPRLDLMLGAVGATAGILLLALSGVTHSLVLFLVSSAVSGFGYALTFLGGVALVGTTAPEHHRAGMFSGVYLVAYLAQGVSALALGAVATAESLGLALDLAAVALPVVFIAMIVLLLVFRDRRGSTPA